MEKAVGGAGDAAGEAATGIFEEAGVVLIVLGALLAVIFGAGAFLLYQAPLILTEAAFELILATSLIRGMKRIDNPDWMGSVLRTTIVPFLITLTVAVTAAFVGLLVHPEATKISEVIRHLVAD
jgi:hypothetical protein